VDVDAIVVDGEWIRHVPHESALLGRADERTDGRWQHGAVVRGLYSPMSPRQRSPSGIGGSPSAGFHPLTPHHTPITSGTSILSSPT
jgi:hypothetical protein